MIGLFSGFRLWRLVGVLAIFGLVGGTVYAGYRYVSNLQEQLQQSAAERATLMANVAQLEQGIVDQQDTIQRLQDDIRLQAEIARQIDADFSQARNQVRALQERLSRHELGFLAANRPGLVENIINNATDEVARCLEIASGSPLTTAEINATLPSQINSECPALANPNYTERP